MAPYKNMTPSKHWDWQVQSMRFRNFCLNPGVNICPKKQNLSLAVKNSSPTNFNFPTIILVNAARKGFIGAQISFKIQIQ